MNINQWKKEDLKRLQQLIMDAMKYERIRNRKQKR